MAQMQRLFPLLVAVFLLALGGVGSELLVTQEKQALQRQAREDSLTRLYALRGQLESELSSTLYLASGIEAFIRADRSRLKKAEIERVLAILYARSHTVRNIGLAPDNRIAHIYPLAGNERALGLYYPDNAQQWPAIEQVIRSRSAFLAGPVKLVQGGEGLIYRVPVFLDDGSYWGLISTVVDADKLWQRVGLMNWPSGWIGISGADARGERGGVVFGSSMDFSPADSIRLEVAVPGGKWVLHGRVHAAAESRLRVLFFRLAGWGVSLLFALGLFLVLRNSERLSRLNVELAASRDAAQAANRARATFLAVMSHEIRTPLNGIMGMTQLLQGSSLDAMQAEYASTIMNSAENLKQIMDDVLDYSLLDSGSLQLKQAAFELIPELEDAAEGFARRAKLKGLGFDWIFSPELPVWVAGDVARVRQTLAHLLSNAIKFSESGSVCLEVLPDEKEQGGVLIRVRDSGVGLDPESLERLMAAFEQADSSSTRRFGGIGLGLSICQRLLAMMGGSLRVESQMGHGACFELRLPLPVQASGKPARLATPDLAAWRICWYGQDSGLRRALEPWLLKWGAQLVALDYVQLATQCVANEADACIRDGMPELMQTGVRQASGLNAPEGRLPLLLLLDERVACESSGDGLGPAPLVLYTPVRLEHFARAVQQLRPLVQTPPLRDDSPAVAGSAARVLLVEDNKTNQKLALAMIRMLGIRVEVANNGREAVEILSREKFDLVFMDIQMPEMDGLEATRLIRDPASCVLDHAVPVVALTANALAVHRDECFAVGMNDFLGKPLDQAALCSALEKHLPAALGRA